MTTFFDRAPIGDPNDPKGQKFLTVRVAPHEKPTDGMLQAIIDDIRRVDWIDVTFPLTGLTLAGMPSDFLDPDDPGDPEIMLELLDRACMYIDDWRKRRAVILPKPQPSENPGELVAVEQEGKPTRVSGKAGK